MSWQNSKFVLNAAMQYNRVISKNMIFNDYVSRRFLGKSLLQVTKDFLKIQNLQGQRMQQLIFNNLKNRRTL